MINYDTAKLLKTFIAVSSVYDGDTLLELILNNALDITNCDAGTLYIVDNNELAFKIMITRSLGIKSGGKNKKINLPNVKMSRSNVCTYSVLENKVVNIPDVYKSDLFDFSGPKHYDKLTGYQTKSMIVVPMVDDRGETIGVMQLLNAKDSSGNIVEFNNKSEMILKAIASIAAIKMTNISYTFEIKRLMESIVKTIAEVIYLRTPYNVSHTHNMAIYAEHFIEWLSTNKENEQIFDEESKQMFLMSIWLHDIGKLATPLEVMDKATRLHEKVERVMGRLDIIRLTTKLSCLENGCDPKRELDKVEEVREFVLSINNKGFLDEETLLKVRALSELTYTDDSGKLCRWFTDDEIDDLMIVRGTLTAKERVVMQNHVLMTKQILEKMDFKNEYSMVPIWAARHHEFIDGSGYPEKLTAKELDLPTRLLTIIDVFDGLSAVDRPYKKPTPIDKVFVIMNEMVKEGKLDGKLLSLFYQSKAWEKGVFKR